MSERLISPHLVLGVVGPTAAGKSAVALRLAEQLGGEVLCCDALQLRAELPILTAKPTPAELERVPHHLFGVLPLAQPATAAQYAELADAAIADIQGRGRVVVLCGGTGLYLRALRDGLFPGPGGDPALRAELQAEVAAHGLPALHQRLKSVDPEAAARIAPADYVRIERALEVYKLSGRTMSAWQADSQIERRLGPRYRLSLIGVDPGPETLRLRIARRVAAMLAAGVIDEVRDSLAVHGPLRHPPLGYDQVRRHLLGELDREAMAIELGHKTAQYARRQRTWFRREPELGRWLSDAAGPDGSAAADSTATLIAELRAALQTEP